MDYQMPIMDGPETSRRINQLIDSNQIEPIPIIGLTAFTSSKDKDICY
jgi:CheY-like chemotaxis protein